MNTPQVPPHTPLGCFVPPPRGGTKITQTHYVVNGQLSPIWVAYHVTVSGVPLCYPLHRHLLGEVWTSDTINHLMWLDAHPPHEAMKGAASALNLPIEAFQLLLVHMVPPGQPPRADTESMRHWLTVALHPRSLLRTQIPCTSCGAPHPLNIYQVWTVADSGRTITCPTQGQSCRLPSRPVPDPTAWQNPAVVNPVPSSPASVPAGMPLEFPSLRSYAASDHGARMGPRATPPHPVFGLPPLNEESVPMQGYGGMASGAQVTGGPAGPLAMEPPGNHPMPWQAAPPEQLGPTDPDNPLPYCIPDRYLDSFPSGTKSR